jgi:hypothetical protein
MVAEDLQLNIRSRGQSMISLMVGKVGMLGFPIDGMVVDISTVCGGLLQQLT